MPTLTNNQQNIRAPENAPATAALGEVSANSAGRKDFIAEHASPAAKKISLQAERMIELLKRENDPKTGSDAFRESRRLAPTPIGMTTLHEIAVAPSLDLQIRKDALTLLGNTDRERGILTAAKAAQSDPQMIDAASLVIAKGLDSQSAKIRELAQTALDMISGRHLNVGLETARQFAQNAKTNYDEKIAPAVRQGIDAGSAVIDAGSVVIDKISAATTIHRNTAMTDNPLAFVGNGVDPTTGAFINTPTKAPEKK